MNSICFCIVEFLQLGLFCRKEFAKKTLISMPLRNNAPEEHTNQDLYCCLCDKKKSNLVNGVAVAHAAGLPQ